MNRYSPPLAIAGLLAVFAIVLVLLTWRAAPVGESPVAVATPPAEPVRSLEPIVPLPRSIELPTDKVALGERLFHDRRFSRDGTIACASCHNLETGGSDRRRVSPGVGGISGVINAPTVFNVGFNFVQFWDGRARTLEEQVAGPIHNPLEMDADWDLVVDRLRLDEDYRQRFDAIYPQGITPVTIADAIATFERSLITPDAPFDRYLHGDRTAISDAAREGYARFKDYGCASCHQGVNVGGNLFQRFGVLGDYFADRGNVTTADLGRFNVTGREQDRHVFKVPSLRNVELTPPYFHDGSAQELEDAIDVMGHYQLGRKLSAEDRRLIASFLRSLTGDLGRVTTP
ncbi:MAG: cytochrome-c peroxidase [Ectothiorhodospiraceae bacterium]|nr:cytochrome-c peroxidase [Ectothiorhodospiraceae bacterium]